MFGPTWLTDLTSKGWANQESAWLILMRMGRGHNSLSGSEWQRWKLHGEFTQGEFGELCWVNMPKSDMMIEWKQKYEISLKWLFYALPLLPTSTKHSRRMQQRENVSTIITVFFFFFLSLSITCRANCFPFSLWFNASLINNFTGRAEWILIDYISHFGEATICAGEAVRTSGRRDTDAEAKGEERDGETEEENRVCKTEDVRVSLGRAD